MPEYFRERGYKCPNDVHDGPFQYAFETNLTFFDHLHRDPTRVQRFNIYMTGNRNVRKHWVEWFPIRKVFLDDYLTQAYVTNEVLLVDIGGGKGHDLERFVEAFPEASGHLVLQDLPGTISELPELMGSIRLMPHDIFTPQPIQGKL